MPAAGTKVARIERGQVEELDAAVADLSQQVGVGAELIGREQLDLEPPAGGLADAVERLLRANVDRVGRVLSGRELVVELRGRGGPGEYTAQRHGGAGCQQRPAADLWLCGCAHLSLPKIPVTARRLGGGPASVDYCHPCRCPVRRWQGASEWHA